MLTAQQGQILVRLARQQIAQHLAVKAGNPVTTDDLKDPALHQTRAVFVTLHKQQDLRGCIGSLAGRESIVEGVKRNALSAAFEDYRFEPVKATELPDLHIEISILTDPQPLTYGTADELIERLRPAVDGVILRGPGGAGATFLPQVWQQLPTPEQFLGHLCRKAGLVDGAWRSGTLQIIVYQVQSFEEPR